jgi:hypothetical protein
MYNKYDLENQDFSKNFYDFASALFSWFVGLFVICFFINKFQKILGIKSIDPNNFEFLFYPLWILIIFPPIILYIILYFAEKRELNVINNNVNFFNKTSSKFIEYKSDNNFYLHLNTICISIGFYSFIFLKFMEASIVLGYSIGVICVAANINGEKEIYYFTKHMKKIMRFILTNIKKPNI